MCVGQACGTPVVPVGQFGEGPQAVCPQQLTVGFSVLQSACWSAACPLPPSNAAHGLVFWVGQERNELLWQCHTSGEVRYSLTQSQVYLRGEILGREGSLGTELCWSCLGGRITWVKSNCSSSFRLFFYPSGVQELF